MTFPWLMTFFKDFHDFSRPGNQSFKFHDYSRFSMTTQTLILRIIESFKLFLEFNRVGICWRSDMSESSVSKPRSNRSQHKTNEDWHIATVAWTSYYCMTSSLCQQIAIMSKLSVSGQSELILFGFFCFCFCFFFFCFSLRGEQFNFSSRITVNTEINTCDSLSHIFGST